MRLGAWLRQWWPWLVAPMALVLVAIGLVLLLTDGSEPFIYVIF